MRTAITLALMIGWSGAADAQMWKQQMGSPPVDCTSANPYARGAAQCNRKSRRSQLECGSALYKKYAIYKKRDPKMERGTVSGWECGGD